MPFRYPVALELEGRRCVVIGGGDVAEHKARALLEAGAVVATVSPRFTPALEELASRGEVELVRRRYREGDLAGAFLAIAATDDASVNAVIHREAEHGRVLLNAVDDTRHCHFAVPALVRRGELTVAISTGGKAPALAKRLRTMLARQLGPEWGTLVEILGQVREEAVARRRVGFTTWARRWQRALDHDLPGLVREGRAGEVRDVVRRALDGRDEPRGKVAIVGAGPGDPGLLTVRGREVLDAADVVVHDRLVEPALVEGREAVYVGKAPGAHTADQERINDLLVGLALSGKKVVRLKGGDPFVFGRGSEEAEALVAAGVEVEVVPGPTSAVAALAYAGIPVTDRRVSSSVAIVTGHCGGGREVDWRGLATAADTVVVLMGLANLGTVVRELMAGGRPGATPAAVVENGTLPSQRVITADLAGLPDACARARIGPPAVVVVGEVVRLRERVAWFPEVDQAAARASSETTATMRSTSSAVL